MDNPYDLVITAVSERADLLESTLLALLAAVDQQPRQIYVHEDVRPGTSPGHIADVLRSHGIKAEHRITNPARGMGCGMLWGFETAQAEYVLYTQEDWLPVRAIPVADTLAVMHEYGLHHIRWNKRKTMRCKHEDKPSMTWWKVEKEIGGHPLCVSDHWYTQTSLWRRSIALPGLRATAGLSNSAGSFIAAYNHWMFKTYGDGRAWNDQEMRHELLRTYIWGPIAEPAYIKHVGSRRGTGKIKDHLEEK